MGTLNKVIYCVHHDFLDSFLGATEFSLRIEANRSFERMIAHFEYVCRMQWAETYCGHLWEHLCHFLIPRGLIDAKLQWLSGRLRRKRLPLRQVRTGDWWNAKVDCNRRNTLLSSRGSQFSSHRRGDQVRQMHSWIEYDIGKRTPD
jgi:hypothetical protein